MKRLKSSVGWIINLRAIPKFLVEEIDDRVLLRPQKTFPKTTIQDVAGCLKHEGPQKSLEEMKDAIKQGVLEQWHDRS